MYLNIILVDAFYLFILSKTEWLNRNSPLADEKKIKPLCPCHFVCLPMLRHLLFIFEYCLNYYYLGSKIQKNPLKTAVTSNKNHSSYLWLSLNAKTQSFTESLHVENNFSSAADLGSQGPLWGFQL